TSTVGELVLNAQGTDVYGDVTVTDEANNASKFSVPLHLPGRPILRLDHTPPEAFNRLDVASLGRQCTTAIGGQAVNYFCTNKVYGADNLPGLTRSSFAPVSVTRTTWGTAGDDDTD